MTAMLETPGLPEGIVPESAPVIDDDAQLHLAAYNVWEACRVVIRLRRRLEEMVDPDEVEMTDGHEYARALIAYDDVKADLAKAKQHVSASERAYRLVRHKMGRSGA